VPLTPGATFERYEIQSLIGRGGMGEVYVAVDTRLRRRVALKVLRDDKEATSSAAGGVQRLLREARSAAALNHPNSVAIYELGEAEGIPYIAMELVIGQSLRSFVGSNTASVETRLGWLVDAARALWAAHKGGVVHRDIKPSNIMISEEGVVKVLDFGLAKPLDLSKEPGTFQTQMGHVLGTPRYMSPEQLEGEPASPAADQFAFGLVAYELLSGAYAGGPLAGAPARLDEIVPGVSADLALAVQRMMSRKPGDRFATMEEAAHALRACAPSLRELRASGGGPPVSHRRATSDAPTRELTDADTSGSVSVEVEVGAAALQNRTLPLALPLAANASMPIASRAMNMTMPLAARPLPPSAPPAPTSSARLPPPAPSSGSLSSFVPQTPVSPRVSVPVTSAPAGKLLPGSSGVYATRAPAPPEPFSRARPSTAWIVVLVLGLVAIAIGSAAAVWFH
jgi:serine/threonine-protein kinase